MTQQDRFRQLFAEFGIEWEQPEPTVTGSCLEVTPHVTPHVSGYTWFKATFYFDHDGKFIEMSVWE
jgi:hypothetical protein